MGSMAGALGSNAPSAGSTWPARRLDGPPPFPAISRPLIGRPGARRDDFRTIPPARDAPAAGHMHRHALNLMYLCDPVTAVRSPQRQSPPADTRPCPRAAAPLCAAREARPTPPNSPPSANKGDHGWARAGIRLSSRWAMGTTTFSPPFPLSASLRPRPVPDLWQVPAHPAALPHWPSGVSWPIPLAPPWRAHPSTWLCCPDTPSAPAALRNSDGLDTAQTFPSSSQYSALEGPRRCDHHHRLQQRGIRAATRPIPSCLGPTAPSFLGPAPHLIVVVISATEAVSAQPRPAAASGEPDAWCDGPVIDETAVTSTANSIQPRPFFCGKVSCTCISK